MFKVQFSEVDRLQQAMEQYAGNTEDAINEVLHDEGTTQLVQERIRALMPVSGKRWKGKKPAAKTSQSMKNEMGNLFVEIKNAKNYQYLYFPNDGSNTRRHVGQQFFFERGGEMAQDEIVDRCVNRLTQILN